LILSNTITLPPFCTLLGLPLSAAFMSAAAAHKSANHSA